MVAQVTPILAFGDGVPQFFGETEGDLGRQGARWTSSLQKALLITSQPSPVGLMFEHFPEHRR
jgi:hypothetical protein